MKNHVSYRIWILASLALLSMATGYAQQQVVSPLYLLTPDKNDRPKVIYQGLEEPKIEAPLVSVQVIENFEPSKEEEIESDGPDEIKSNSSEVLR